MSTVVVRVHVGEFLDGVVLREADDAVLECVSCSDETHRLIVEPLLRCARKPGRFA